MVETQDVGVLLRKYPQIQLASWYSLYCGNQIWMQWFDKCILSYEMQSCYGKISFKTINCDDPSFCAVEIVIDDLKVWSND